VSIAQRAHTSPLTSQFRLERPQCGTLLGASGSTLEYPVLRYASNLESVLACEGTEVVHRLAVGKGGYGLLGLPPCGDVGGHRTFVAIRPLSADSSDRSVYL
jgi:hypothetical protein